MHKLSTSFILGYHGCPQSIAESVLAGESFKPSQNDYDWLGHGIYFWQANPRRAFEFAKEKRERDAADWVPAVVGAVIEPGLCLDLSAHSGIEHVRDAHRSLVEQYDAAGWKIPANHGGSDLLLRSLDCAVIQLLHDVRRSTGQEPVDTVSGIFIEGEPIYGGSGFYEKTHIQICVCNPRVIKGVFRVPDAELAN